MSAAETTAAQAVRDQSANPGTGNIPTLGALIIGIATLITTGNIKACGWSLWVLLTWVLSIVLIVVAAAEGTIGFLNLAFLERILSSFMLTEDVRGKILVLSSLLMGGLGLLTFFTWSKPEAPKPAKGKDEDEDEDEASQPCGAYASRIALLVTSIVAILLAAALMSGQLGRLLNLIPGVDLPPVKAPGGMEFSFFNRNG